MIYSTWSSHGIIRHSVVRDKQGIKNYYVPMICSPFQPPSLSLSLLIFHCFVHLLSCSRLLTRPITFNSKVSFRN